MSERLSFEQLTFIKVLGQAHQAQSHWHLLTASWELLLPPHLTEGETKVEKNALHKRISVEPGSKA